MHDARPSSFPDPCRAIGVPYLSGAANHCQTDLALVWRSGQRLEHMPVLFSVYPLDRLSVCPWADTLVFTKAASHDSCGDAGRQLSYPSDSCVCDVENRRG